MRALWVFLLSEPLDTWTSAGPGSEGGFPAGAGAGLGCHHCTQVLRGDVPVSPLTCLEISQPRDTLGYSTVPCCGHSQGITLIEGLTFRE